MQRAVMAEQCSCRSVVLHRGHIRQGNQTIFVPFGVADMDVLIFGIDIAHPKTQAFAEMQAKTIDGEIFIFPIRQNGAGEWIRTTDLLITNQLLYQTELHRREQTTSIQLLVALGYS